MELQTTTYKISGKKIMTVLLWEYGVSWLGFAIVIMFLIGGLSIIYDYRFIILALIWLFIVIPMGVLLLFFIYGMQPLTTYNTILHELRFDNHSLTINLWLDPEEKTESREFTLEYKEIKKIKRDSDSVIIFGGGDFKGWLCLPFGAFHNYDDFETVMNKIGDSLNKKPLHSDYENSQG